MVIEVYSEVTGAMHIFRISDMNSEKLNTVINIYQMHDTNISLKGLSFEFQHHADFSLCGNTAKISCSEYNDV